jgi:hypothetical protein
MTLTIDIRPELEGKLHEEADRRGVPAEDLARTFIEERLLSSNGSPLWERLADWEQAFDDFIASQDPHRPTLSDVAMSRESFYGERG